MKIHINLCFLIIFSAITGELYAQENSKSCSHLKRAASSLSKIHTPSLNQQSYDVSFYDINLDLYPLQQKLDGKVRVVFKAKDELTSVELDFASAMTVDRVSSGSEAALKFSHDKNKLNVTLNQSLGEGKSDTVTIEYNGKPQSTGFGSFGFNSYGGKPMIWTLSEPYGARSWWPCKDTPTDKADSVNITVSVPLSTDTLIVASNGLLKKTEYDSDRATYYWEERYPITTYLVSLAVYPYRVFYDWYTYGKTDSMRLDYYVFPDNYNNARPNYMKTKDMISVYAAHFGEYPFIKEKYGHADFLWGGGMEHQTLSSMGGTSEGLIAHELTHQWWGDMVTCGNFHHIWLNEGFATYGEALWYEAHYGKATFQQDMQFKKYFGGGTVYRPDTSNVSSIFSGDLSYDKASWVLHMLRHVVGDSLFFDGTKAYRQKYEFKSAVTEEFRDVMAAVSGKNLDDFFQQWIYGEYFPVYDVRYFQMKDSLRLIIRQEQKTGYFTLPIDFKIQCKDTVFIAVVENSGSVDTAFIPLPSGDKVNSVILDPDDWILKSATVLSAEDELTLPHGFTLYPVYPNPFNARATIQFDLAFSAPVSLKVYDITGKQVDSLVDQQMQRGQYTVQWKGTDVSSGVYFIRLDAGEFRQTRKVILLK